MTLNEIIKRIALRQEVPVELVRGFVLEAFDEIVDELDRGGAVKIRGLGSLEWKEVPPITLPQLPGQSTSQVLPKGKKLRFMPAGRFKKRRTQMSNNDEGMTKLGVELDEDLIKEATPNSKEGGSCSTCGRELDNARACPVHGTKPLESSRR